MTYSAALGLDQHEDLETAQRRKYEHLAQMFGIAPGHEVLEIGCGWGGFAEFATATIGCKLTGISISRAQTAYSQSRIAVAGVDERVAIQFCDYRDTGRSTHLVCATPCGPVAVRVCN